MAALERRTLKKAPQLDVVDAFTRDQTPATQDPAAIPKPNAPVSDTAPASVNMPDATPAPTADAGRTKASTPSAPERRGPGRPRSKRRMESLATKIDIELRDQVDAYLEKTGGTLVNLIDEALRARIAQK